MVASGSKPSPAALAVEAAFRKERARVLAALRSTTSSLEEAEDMLSSALEKALVHWSRDGIPERPGAWLLKVARNDALGAIRHTRVTTEKREAVTLFERQIREVDEPASADYPDERLPLMLTCCHPSLDGSARVALTLSVISGLSTPEIARAFLVPTATIAQRIVRAKRKIRHAKVPFAVPPRETLPERLEEVFRVIYLVFTEGYRASRGERRIRLDLCEDALALAHALSSLVPQEPEALGLEALLWFHHCRRSARQDAEGGIIFLEAQDRSLFVQRELEHAEELLHRALAKKRVGPYQLQASIAAAHCCSPSFELTPWPLIIQLYARLYELQPSPVVALNWAGAVGLGEGAERGLEEIQRHGLARSLAEYSPYHSARAELLSRAGHTAEARAAFEKAAELAQGGAEVALIRRRLKEISEN